MYFSLMKLSTKASFCYGGEHCYKIPVIYVLLIHISIMSC